MPAFHMPPATFDAPRTVLRQENGSRQIGHSLLANLQVGRVPQDSHGLRTPDRVPHATSYLLQAVTPDLGPRTTDNGPRTTDFGPRTTDRAAT